jgi:hypothetical protein
MDSVLMRVLEINRAEGKSKTQKFKDLDVE